MLNACICTFHRERDSKPEAGIAIPKFAGVHDLHMIVTAAGKSLDKVWSYQLQPHFGAFTFDPKTIIGA